MNILKKIYHTSRLLATAIFNWGEYVEYRPHKYLFMRLARLANSLGYDVITKSDEEDDIKYDFPIMGYCHREINTIVLRPNVPSIQVQALSHEIGHILIKDLRGYDTRKRDEPFWETEFSVELFGNLLRTKCGDYNICPVLLTVMSGASFKGIWKAWAALNKI